MRTSSPLQPILSALLEKLYALFGNHIKETILFGSYARGEADVGSDIDVFVLVDIPHEIIPQYTWQLGELASDLLLDYGIMVSPIVENEEHFLRYVDIFPLYRNIHNEGVRISA